MNIETKWYLIPEECDERDFPDLNETVLVLIEDTVLDNFMIKEQLYYPAVRYARLIKNTKGSKYKWMLMDCQEEESCYVQQTVVAWRYLK